MNVVVVGGGFCGSFIAKRLQDSPKIKTTLIDKHPFFEYKPNLHQILTRKKGLSNIQIPYTSFLHSTRILTEPVLHITETLVMTENQTIPYDYLVITSGIDYPILLNNSNDIYVLQEGETVNTLSKKLREVEKVLIVGGGIIGCEIAGELAFSSHQFKVTLVHSKDRLMERNSRKASDYAFSILKNAGCTIIRNEKIIKKENHTYTTNKNRNIPADICIWCTGIKPNPSFMYDFPDDCFTEDRFLQVNTYLQLKNYHHIFVGGDLASIPEEKTARKAEFHAHIIETNIKRSIQKKPLLAYHSKPTPMIISLGSRHGIIQLNKAITGVLPANAIKNVIQHWIFNQLKKRGI